MDVYEVEPSPTVPPTLPRVRFEAIEEAWQLLRAQLGVWIGACVIGFLIVGGIAGGDNFYMAGIAARTGQSFQMGKRILLPPESVPFVLGGFIAAFVLILVLHGSLMRMAIRQVKGETIRIGLLFNAFDVFWRLLGYVLLVGFIIGGLQSVARGIVYVIGPQAQTFATVFYYVLSCYLFGLLLCCVPLIVDRYSGVFDAFRDSIATLAAHGIYVTLFFIAIHLIAGLGFLVFGVGAFVSLPLLYLTQAILYRDMILRQGL